MDHQNSDDDSLERGPEADADADADAIPEVSVGTPICVFYFSHPFSIGSHEPRSRSLPVHNIAAQTDHVTSAKVPELSSYCKRRTIWTANGVIPVRRRRRRQAKKRSSWTLVKYLTESVRLHSRRSELPCLEDVVHTLQAAWPLDTGFTKCPSDHGGGEENRDSMAMAHNHANQDRGSSGFPSPVFLRRRLSAPETIMRKHMLSQQRSESTESDSTQISSVSSLRQNNFWNRSSTTGSESNLLARKQYKRDPDLMRKSTLLRRMWSREFSGSVGRLYNEEIFPKKNSLQKSQSRSPVRSIRSSLEHINKERLNGKFSPERVRLNGDVTASINSKNKWETVPDMNSCSSFNSDVISRVSSTSESNKSILETSSTDIKISSFHTTTSTENETFTTTRSTTATTNSNSNMDDNSDSAFTNTQTYSSYSTTSKNNSENNNNNNTDNDNISFGGIAPTPVQMSKANHIEQGQSDKQVTNTQATHDLNSNENPAATATAPPNSSTENKCNNNQRSDVSESVPKIDEQTTELNIVNLSAATLNIIINNAPETNNKVHENITRAADQLAKTVQQQQTEQPKSAQKPESFYLKRKEDVHISADHCRIIKYMISNVGAGSPYTKPTEAPQLVVPRYSALPRSVSMEVNTSSADSTDKESDTASLVDSLDDPNSPRQSALTPRIKYDDKPVRGDLSALLPDNSVSSKDTPRPKPQKGSAFYVPIQEDVNKNVKTVAEHLPERVRNKLSKRQEKMEQKKLNAKNKMDNLALDPNGNQSDSFTTISKITEPEITTETTWTSNGTLKKVKKEKKAKQVLQSLPSYKVNAKGELTLNPNAAAKLRKSLRQPKKKIVNNSESSESSSNTITLRRSLWTQHSQLQSPTTNENKSDLITESMSQKQAEQIGYNNRIEILEIMECVEHSPEKSLQNSAKNSSRSKIPVLIQNKMSDVPHKQIQMQTIYHAYDITRDPEYSPKTDQLIANILIDALNKSDMVEIKAHEAPKIIHHQSSNEKRPTPMSANKIPANRYHQKFEIIPEEKLSSLGSSAEDSSATNIDNKINLVKQSEEIKSVEVQTQEQKCLTDASSQTDLAIAAAEATHRIPSAYKGKAALAMIKDEDFSTIPKGWITFYMLRKNPGSPDSSTDEGTNVENKTNADEKSNGLELRQLKPVLVKRKFGKDNLSDIHEANVINIAQETNNNYRINNNPLREEDTRKSLSLEHLNETIVITKREHCSSSSESSKSHSPVNDHEPEPKSACPSLPIALPSRQGRRHSHRRGRYKTTSQSQGTNASQVPGGWSVTVSGTNTCGQPAPDLEMRLKFPCPQPTSQSDSGLGEEHPRQPRRHFQQQQNDNDFHLPPAKPSQTKKYTVITRKQNDMPDDLANSRSFQYLPDLIKNKNQRPAKRRDCSVPVTRSRHLSQQRLSSSLDLGTSMGMGMGMGMGVPSMPPLKHRMPASGGLRPRQTLTSFRRFSLHHSSHLSPHFRTLLPSAFSDEAINQTDIIDLPECFPAILAVTGSQISPENKPRVPTMSEKDLTRNHFNFGQHHA